MRSPLKDLSEGLARLYRPGSLVYALRPKGWGKTTLLEDLSILVQGGSVAQTRFTPNTWIRRHKNILFRQPKMIPLLLKLSFEELQLESCHNQLCRQLLPATATSTQTQAMQELVHSNEILTAISLASQLHKGTRIAVLVDDFDDAFLRQERGDTTNGETRETTTLHVLSQLLESVEKKRGGGLLLMKGTFRPGALRSIGLLSKMRDLSLDLHHNNTWGRSLANKEDDEKERERHDIHISQRKGYAWNALDMRPVLHHNEKSETFAEEGAKAATVTNKLNLQRKRFNCSGGYWYGGCKESTGTPEAMAPLRPWMPFAHRSDVQHLLFEGGGVPLSATPPSSSSVAHLARGLATLVSGTYTMSTMNRYLNETVTVLLPPSTHTTPTNSDDSNDSDDSTPPTPTHHTHNDWAVVLLQAGVLTMASRSMRFDEFHTYAWCRTHFPNERARQEFVHTVLKPVLIMVAQVPNEVVKGEEGREEDHQAALQWSHVENILTTISNKLANNKDKSGEASLQMLVQIAHSMSIQLQEQISVETCLKCLLLGVSHLHLDDGIGNAVADAGTSLDTFANKDDLLESIRPVLTQWDMRYYALDGRIALPVHVQPRIDQGEAGTMALHNFVGDVCGVLKLEGNK